MNRSDRRLCLILSINYYNRHKIYPTFNKHAAHDNDMKVSERKVKKSNVSSDNKFFYAYFLFPNFMSNFNFKITRLKRK